MILIDHFGHLTSTISEEELHEFAQRIGLKRAWFQDGRHPHYDCTTPNMRGKAIRFGAKLTPPTQLLRRSWYAPTLNTITPIRDSSNGDHGE